MLGQLKMQCLLWIEVESYCILDLDAVLIIVFFTSSLGKPLPSPHKINCQ